MTDAERLALLKIDLQLMTNAFDAYLLQLLAAARGFIAREGATLTQSAEDEQLLRMYAAYLYRKRAEDAPVMPRMLRWALNNRIFSEKVGDADAARQRDADAMQA